MRKRNKKPYKTRGANADNCYNVKMDKWVFLMLIFFSTLGRFTHFHKCFFFFFLTVMIKRMMQEMNRH